MEKKKQFSPQTLRGILGFLFVALLIGGAALCYLGIEQLKAYAVQVEQRLADADASGRQISELQTLKNQLAQSNSLIEKANQVFATPGAYQGQVLNDLRRYADAAGLSLANTNFSGDGVKSVTFSFREPVSYSKLIAFLNNVEGNLPKLQVASIELGRAGTGSADSIKVGQIKIDISVR